MSSISGAFQTQDEKTQLLANGVVPGSRFCPQCGATMREIDRTIENGAIYVWYACEDTRCDGQWLQRYSQISA